MRRPQNLFAASIALLALVVAATGTAVAATTTTTISDPSNTSYIAHVDAAGRLQVGGSVGIATPTQPFFALQSVPNFYNGQFQTVLGPTLSTLALTQLTLANEARDGKSWSASVYQVAATSSTCGSVDYTHRLGQIDAQSGAAAFDDLTPPTYVHPLAANQYYCIVVGAEPTDYTSDTSSVFVSARGYVISGSTPASPYTKAGASHDATG